MRNQRLYVCLCWRETIGSLAPALHHQSVQSNTNSLVREAVPVRLPHGINYWANCCAVGVIPRCHGDNTFVMFLPYIVSYILVVCLPVTNSNFIQNLLQLENRFFWKQSPDLTVLNPEIVELLCLRQRGLSALGSGKIVSIYLQIITCGHEIAGWRKKTMDRSY